MTRQPQTQDEQRLLQLILQESAHGDRDLFDSLTESERQYVLAVLREVTREGASHVHDRLWELDYRERPVPIVQFLDDDYYLGKVGRSQGPGQPARLFAKWREDLESIFAPGRRVNEILLSGAIGTGKTTMAMICLIYKLYQLSCLRDPQGYYSMVPGSPIVFGLYNVFKYKVETTSFAMMSGMLGVSAYFTETWPRDPEITSVIRFPSHIRVVTGSTALHTLGENLFACALDETDFMRAGADEDAYGQAYELYTNTARRMESRFMHFGFVPGIQALISSKTSTTGFIEQRIHDRRNDPNAFIADYPLWQVKPERYSGKKFFVFVGDERSDPRVLTDEEAAQPQVGKVITVPIEHRKSFEEDCTAALRDIAGQSTVSGVALIPSRECLAGCVDQSRTHPFTQEEFSITVDDSTSIEDFLVHEKILRVSRSQWMPLVNPGAARFIHIDIGLVNDALGFAMGHRSGYREATVTDERGFEYTTRSPLIYIDLALRIVPKPGTRIDLQKVRNFVYALREFGFHIVLVTGDNFEGEDNRQQLAKMGFEIEVVSMDKHQPKLGHPYMYIRDATLEKRVSFYHHPRLLLELANLQRDLDKNKVDHPPFMVDFTGNRIKGSKDVADAVGAVVRNIMVAESIPEESGAPARVAKGTTQAQVAIHDRRPPEPRVVEPRNPGWVASDYHDLGRVIGLR